MDAQRAGVISFLTMCGPVGPGLSEAAKNQPLVGKLFGEELITGVTEVPATRAAGDNAATPGKKVRGSSRVT